MSVQCGGMGWEVIAQCSLFLVAPDICICVLICVFNSIPETLRILVVVLNTLTMTETFRRASVTSYYSPWYRCLRISI